MIFSVAHSPRFHPMLVCFIVLLQLSFGSANHCSGAPIAEGAGKFLGNITSGRISTQESHFLDYWNQVTPENEGKWGSVEGRRNSMNWSNLDNAYQFAKNNNLPFKQHTFIWGRQEPGWIGDLTPEEQLSEVKEWIQLFSERYPDVEYIDVVNEPISHPATYREALGGSGTTGFDWIIWSFKEARSRFPKAKLLINEYNVIHSDAMTDAMILISELLKERGLIDGIGLQSHYFSFPQTTAAVVKNNLDRLGATGIPIYSTEFDATGDDAEQLATYKTFFPLFWEHPCVAGITLWGWMEGRTWESNTYLINSDGSDRPAFTWLKEYIANHLDVIKTRKPFSTTVPASPLQLRASQHGTTIRVTLPKAGTYSLSCTTIAGKSIASWQSRYYPDGKAFVTAPALAPGRYILKAITTNGSVTRCYLSSNNFN